MFVNLAYRYQANQPAAFVCTVSMPGSVDKTLSVSSAESFAAARKEALKEAKKRFAPGFSVDVPPAESIEL